MDSNIEHELDLIGCCKNLIKPIDAVNSFLTCWVNDVTAKIIL
jgi:hypothetical protein